jgi:hypothetical protein
MIFQFVSYKLFFSQYLDIPEKLSLVQPSPIAEGSDSPPLLEAGEKLALRVEVKTSSGESVKEESGRIISFTFQFISSSISSNHYPKI